jgi:polyhydroxyalkanoate synthesis repressor PhaR
MLCSNELGEIRMAKAKSGEGPVTIKKYANRRLYNTETSSYITLDNLSQMVREGRDFRVVDAKSNEDITHTILTQIIMEEEGRGKNMLPPGFLRQLISLYGDSMQAMVPQYLEASMEAFRRNQTQFRSMLEGALTAGPFGELHKRNMAMFEAASDMFSADKAAPSEPAATEAAKDDEIATLKAQLAALQAKVDKLG